MGLSYIVITNCIEGYLTIAFGIADVLWHSKSEGELSVLDIVGAFIYHLRTVLIDKWVIRLARIVDLTSDGLFGIFHRGRDDSVEIAVDIIVPQHMSLDGGYRSGGKVDVRLSCHRYPVDLIDHNLLGRSGEGEGWVTEQGVL